MCGRFALDDKVNAAITDWVEAGGQAPPSFQSSWNVKPTHQIPLMFETLGDGGEIVRHAEPARWSLIPPWAKEPKMKFPTFNARSEGMAGKNTWRYPLKRSRAIIPASGYYEWVKQPGKTRNGPPHYIHLPDDEVIYFAGLYSWWKPQGSEDGSILTATIVTRDATGPVADLHDRTPVILPDDAMGDWLDPGTEGDQTLVDAMVSASTPVIESLEFHEVAPLRGDGPELTEPVSLT